MVVRSYFVPDDFVPTDRNREWAMDKFGITSEEVDRQTGLLMDHEFQRKYSDWQRVFRNWIRKADDMEKLRRPRKYRGPEEITEEQRQEDIRKWHEDQKRLRLVK